jgi:hypothetical protein
VQTIEILHVSSSYITQISDNAFKFRADKKYHWLQKVCFKILSSIGAFQQVTTERIERHKTTEEDIIKKIAQHVRNIETQYHCKVTRILMGEEDFLNYQRSTPISYVSFNLKGEHRFYGVQIVVVPWMSGILADINK